ncbi:hypothetical protein PG593_06890 [Riemerella anatipestifer]|nr:hypothetical protein [Riemerella anatipestifer]
MPSTIKFAVLGYGGYIGQRHADILSQLENADWVALIDTQKYGGLVEVSQHLVPCFETLSDLWESGIEVDVGLCMYT